MLPLTINARIAQLDQTSNSEVLKAVIAQLNRQHLHAQFSAEQIADWCNQFGLSTIDLALACLPIAACYANPPVSNFYVGAVAIGKSRKFYFGANQEFVGNAISQSVHAEQSAISHAFTAGETGITDVIVNYTPCGHCRQFMNELNTADTLKIHLPHSQNNLLHHYLPDAFGPSDLQIRHALFAQPPHHFPEHQDPVIHAAIQAASRAYAPYSEAMSGVALQVGQHIITGQYMENAAFNPSFLPMQSALNNLRLRGLEDVPITRIVLAEKQTKVSHRSTTEALAHHIGLTLEYIPL